MPLDRTGWQERTALAGLQGWLPPVFRPKPRTAVIAGRFVRAVASIRSVSRWLVAGIVQAKPGTGEATQGSSTRTPSR